MPQPQPTQKTILFFCFALLFSISGMGQSSFFVDDDENVYKCGPDWVKKFKPNETEGIIVAGGNGLGGSANQLRYPIAVIVDEKGDIFICDSGNHRIQKWEKGANVGITVAGGNGDGSASNQLNFPNTFLFDSKGALIICDVFNKRIQKWEIGSKEGISIVDLKRDQNQTFLLRSFAKGKDDFLYISIVKVSSTGAWSGGILKWKIGESVGVDYVPKNNTDSQFPNFIPDIILLDKFENLYVKNSNQNHIIKLAANATFGKTIIYSANEITINFDKKDNLWVSETKATKFYKQPKDASNPILGQFLNTEIAIEGNNLKKPTGVFVSDFGNIFIDDSGNNRILKFAQNTKLGETVINSTGIEDYVQNAFFVDRFENVYYNNTQNDGVFKFQNSTKELKIIAGGNGIGNAKNQLNKPNSIWVSQNGDVYVCDYGNKRVQKWELGSLNGITIAGEEGNNFLADENKKFTIINSISVDQDSSLYINDIGGAFSEKIVVEKWIKGSKEGIPIAVGKDYYSYNPYEDFQYAKCIFLDSKKNLYTIDDRKILKWTPNALIPEYVVGSLPSKLIFKSPEGFTIAPNGDIYIADTGNNRILKVNPNVKIVEKSASQKTLTEYNGAYFLTQTNDLIAKIIPDEANLAMGEVTASVVIDAIQDQSFVKRHYKIETNNPAHKSKISLYFTQAEFDSYNNSNEKKLPTNPLDKNGIANVIITSQKISTGRRTLPIQTTIEMPDNQIVWNENLNVWEVSFEDTGSKEYWLRTKFEYKQSTNPRREIPIFAKKNGREGVEEEVIFEPNSFEIYPNPVSKTFTLQINDAKLIGTKASLTNEVGQSVKTIFITKQTEQIDVEKLPSGIYFIEFSNGKSGKFLKE